MPTTTDAARLATASSPSSCDTAGRANARGAPGGADCVVRNAVGSQASTATVTYPPTGPGASSRQPRRGRADHATTPAATARHQAAVPPNVVAQPVTDDVSGGAVVSAPKLPRPVVVTNAADVSATATARRVAPTANRIVATSQGAAHA